LVNQLESEFFKLRFLQEELSCTGLDKVTIQNGAWKQEQEQIGAAEEGSPALLRHSQLRVRIRVQSFEARRDVRDGTTSCCTSVVKGGAVLSHPAFLLRGIMTKLC
jgi:hypothetical protein